MTKEEYQNIIGDVDIVSAIEYVKDVVDEYDADPFSEQWQSLCSVLRRLLETGGRAEDWHVAKNDPPKESGTYFACANYPGMPSEVCIEFYDRDKGWFAFPRIVRHWMPCDLKPPDDTRYDKA